MTADEYAALATACDALLLDPAASPDRLNVAWLHLMSEHPAVLRHYAGALQGRGPSASARAKEMLRIARIIGARHERAVDTVLPACADILIVSHLVNPAHAGATTDFYFGELPDYLATHGLQVVVALINHAPGDVVRLARAVARTGALTRTLLPRTLGLTGEVHNLLRARALRRGLRERARGGDASAAVARAAAGHTVATGTLAAMRIAQQIGALARGLQPRMLLLTHEGHAWERATMRAVRAAVPAIRCVGYQHTILFPRQHAISRGLTADCNPDLILTIGESNAQALRARPALAGARIEVYGSHRRAAARAREPNPARCLVLPEGLEAESVTLYGFAIRCARLMPGFEFVLRAHPVLPVSTVLERHPQLRDLPPNVHISDEAHIGADFDRCGWALYRGSSAAIHAVLAGLLPVYLSQAGEMPIDPLFTLQERPTPVARPEEFAERVAAQTLKGANIAAAERRAALSWGDSYVVPPRHELVARLLAT
ncbi:MAG: hypothetical protein ABIT36_01285 [Steroidobacteraceae bacterium]